MTVKNEDLKLIIDEVNPVLSYDLAFHRYTSLKDRYIVSFSADEYINFCKRNEVRRDDRIFLKETGCNSNPKTLNDFRIIRGGFRGGVDLLSYQNIKSRYEYLLKKHGRALRFSLNEFRNLCEKMQVRNRDAFYTPKNNRRKIFLDDLILKRNVRRASVRMMK